MKMMMRMKRMENPKDPIKELCRKRMFGFVAFNLLHEYNKKIKSWMQYLSNFRFIQRIDQIFSYELLIWLLTSLVLRYILS